MSNEKTHAREALLKAASRLFEHRGYSAVSTRDIAQEAGVNLGSIQYYFGSKSQLFVESVRSMMSSLWASAGVLQYLESRVESKEAAAIALCGLVAGYLREIFFPCGPNVLRVLYREVLGEATDDPELNETLLRTMVEEYSRSLDEQTARVLRMLKPEISENDIELVTQSIFGQCSFYFTNRAFLERLRGRSLANENEMKIIAEHIVRFTLLALGLEEPFIKKAISAAGNLAAPCSKQSLPAAEVK
jgi:TetR/AcrR family transcriptional regulator, regulator of cefoperazone and chloramphenicol sensitivity